MEGAGLPADLCALDAAPTHGLNARALILRAAAAAAAEASGDEEEEIILPAAGPDPARLAAEARTAALRAGRALAAAWPQAEKPYPDLIKNSKVPRVSRVPVLARLAGEHLALTLHARGGEAASALRSDPPHAARALASPADRAAAVAAARAQELGLYKEAINGSAYNARACRASALDAGEEAAAAGTAAVPAPPRRVLKRSAPVDESGRRAGPDPRPPPRRRRRSVGVEEAAVLLPASPAAAGEDWTAGDAGSDPHTAVRACAAGKDLAAHFSAALAPLVDAGELSATAAATGLESALSKVLAAHGAAALTGERGWLDGPGARERLRAFAVACARTSAAREVRAAKAARAAAWGAARVERSRRT